MELIKIEETPPPQRNVFKDIDSDQDGQLSREEVIRLLFSLAVIQLLPTAIWFPYNGRSSKTSSRKEKGRETKKKIDC